MRIEFFGDEVEQLRYFSVADQRSIGDPLESTQFPASRELLLSGTVRQRAKEMQHEFPSIAGMLAKISEGIPVEGMESLAPVLVDKLVPLTDYLPKDAAIAVLSPERVSTRAVSLLETNREFLAAAWSAATAGAEAPIDLDAGDFLTLGALRLSAGNRAWWTLSGFDSGESTRDEMSTSSIQNRTLGSSCRGRGLHPHRRDPGSEFAGQLTGAIEHVKELTRDGWTVAIAALGTGLVERAADVLAEHEVRWPDGGDVAGGAGRRRRVPRSSLRRGGVRASGDQARRPQRIRVLRPHRRLRLPPGQATRAQRKNVVDPLQLKAGDFVVHQTHGIGKFVELTQREVSQRRPQPGEVHARVPRHRVRAQQARLPGRQALRVRPTSSICSPATSAARRPRLSKMGGSDWAAAKGKARRAVRDIAVELVKLYSARMACRGHAFPPDTPWQHELEEAFPFVETPDQLTTIDEVKRDMESPIPMDRLLSGDVGYGKTEVAVRAAFKAIQDGKQVAMIVPTTLLVKQHMETFTERFAGFPVHLRPLSRFQTDGKPRRPSTASPTAASTWSSEPTASSAQS